MKISRSMCVWVSCVSLMFVAAAYAQQQERIPGTVMSASSLGSEQRAVVQRIVSQALDDLVNGSDQQVAAGRQHLIGEYRRANTLGGSSAFFRTYATEIAAGLPRAMQSERLVTRLNAAILVRVCRSSEIVRVIEAGLADENSAVRFAMAQSISQLVQNDQEANTNARVFEQADYQAILEALNNSLETESDARALRVMYLAMARLPIADAQRTVLATLERQLEQLQQADVYTSIASEEAAMRALYMDLTTAREPVIARELSRVAARYLVFSARQLDQHDMPQDLVAQRERMIKVCEAIMVYSSDPIADVPKLQQRDSTIEQLQQAVSKGQWLEAALHAEQLRSVIRSN